MFSFPQAKSLLRGVGTVALHSNAKLLTDVELVVGGHGEAEVAHVFEVT